MKKLNRIEKEIVEAINLNAKKEWNKKRSRKDWTKIIKNTFVFLGKKHGYNSYTSGNIEGKKGGEWLFDLSWFKESKGQIKTLELVCEIEWDKIMQERIFDFQKLAVTYSNSRVFITGVYKEEFHSISNELIKSISQFQTSAIGNYLIIGIPETKEYTHSIVEKFVI